jgi:ribonuclease-3
MGFTGRLHHWFTSVSSFLRGGGRRWRGAALPPIANREELELKIGYAFKDESLLRRSLLHRSHIIVAGTNRQESNERMEFLGDAVLGLVVNEYLFARFPKRTEGDLTKMKSLLVCGARLSEVAAHLELGSHIKMSRSEAATGGRQRLSILADTMEALIGAVYLDGGLAAARQVIRRCLLAKAPGLLTRRSLGNYKSRLQEAIQERYKSPPRYRVLNATGPDHERIFTVGVYHNGIELGSGHGHNKKTAEQRAAQAALERLEMEPDLLDAESD